MERRIRDLRRRRQLSGGDQIRSATPASARRRRISRREREARRQRLLITAMAIIGGLVLLILAGFAINDFIVKPRAVLASVNGTDIRRRDYWKFRSVELFDQARQYQDFAGFSQGDQQLQFLQFAAQLEAQRSDVWGSTDVDEPTLNQMIDNQLYLQNLDDLGLSISNVELDQFILTQFDPQDAPLVTPVPSPTLIPTRAAWATGTAGAGATESAARASTSEASAPESGTPLASPIGTSTPELLFALTPRASPFSSPSGSPIAAGTPPSPATPNAAEALATAEAGFEIYREQVFEGAHLSRDDYASLIARPRLARQKVEAELASSIGQSAEQIRGSHILVGTRDLAEQLYTQLRESDARFADLAREQSIDPATAANGGDLGWFTSADVPEQLANAALAIEPGQVSAPFETEFGWHIVMVAERAADRPLTEAQIQTLRQSAIVNWLAERRELSDIESDLKPTPTTPAGQFVPPPNAPPAPTPTMAVTAAVASPIASPIIGPLAPPVATVAP